jgi:hypothetical protein
MGRGLGDVFAVLVTAPAHDVQKQDTALARIDHVLHGGSDKS